MDRSQSVSAFLRVASAARRIVSKSQLPVCRQTAHHAADGPKNPRCRAGVLISEVQPATAAGSPRRLVQERFLTGACERARQTDRLIAMPNVKCVLSGRSVTVSAIPGRAGRCASRDQLTAASICPSSLLEVGAVRRGWSVNPAIRLVRIVRNELDGDG